MTTSASERLSQAKEDFYEGRYEDALAGQIWFHNHALEEDPYLSAVRLSFGLGAWVELGKVYPPAMEALAKVRQANADRLLGGELDTELFQEVVAIDRYMDKEQATYELYKQLAGAYPDLHRRFGYYALTAIVAVKDFALAEKVAPDTETMIRKDSAWLNRDMRLVKYRTLLAKERRWATVMNHGAAIREALAIKRGNGHFAEAERLHALAIDLIESPSLRREVAATIIKPPRPPMPKDCKRKHMRSKERRATSTS